MDGKIGILCAGDEELEPFLACLENETVRRKAMLDFHEGTIGDCRVVLLYSGVCKVNAAVAAQLLIDQYQVSMLINAGVAGGMKESVRIFDTVVSTETAYHDVSADILTEFHPWMPSVYFPSDAGLLAAAKRAVERFAHPVHFGRSVTGEAFIAEERRAEINELFAPLSVDMESASVAHVCYVNQIPFLAVRTITDDAAHTGQEHFEENCKRASALARDFVLLLLQEYPAVSM